MEDWQWGCWPSLCSDVATWLSPGLGLADDGLPANSLPLPLFTTPVCIPTHKVSVKHHHSCNRLACTTIVYLRRESESHL